MSDNLTKGLEETLRPEIENLGYELIEVEFKPEDGDYYLTF